MAPRRRLARCSVWRLGSEARLLIPDLHEYEDADELIQTAVAKIAKYEARPEHDVLLDIAEPMVDAQFYRIHPDAPSGSVPLPTGVKAAESVLNLMKTAATAVEQGLHLLYEGRRSQQVDGFLHRVLLGSATPAVMFSLRACRLNNPGHSSLTFSKGRVSSPGVRSSRNFIPHWRPPAPLPSEY